MARCPHCGCGIESSGPLVFGNIGTAAPGEISLDGRPMYLPRKLYDLVVTLVAAKGRALSRDYLAAGLQDDPTDEAIVKLIERARRCFRRLDPEFDQIETLRGFGAYRWSFRHPKRTTSSGAPSRPGGAAGPRAASSRRPATVSP